MTDTYFLSSLSPLWLAGAVLIAAPALGRMYLRRRRQTRELLAMARRHNLKFSPMDLIGLQDRYYNLDMIRRGHSRHSWNVLYGSTACGLTAIFRFSYDVGFGTRQTSQQWWVAVLESPRVLDGWQAELAPLGPAVALSPIDEVHPPADETRQARIGPFMIQADRASTLAMLVTPAFSELLSSMNDVCHIEARGLLLAIAAPFENDPAMTERLLNALGRLARELQAAAL